MRKGRLFGAIAAACMFFAVGAGGACAERSASESGSASSDAEENSSETKGTPSEAVGFYEYETVWKYQNGTETEWKSAVAYLGVGLVGFAVTEKEFVSLFNDSESGRCAYRAGESELILSESFRPKGMSFSIDKVFSEKEYICFFDGPDPDDCLKYVYKKTTLPSSELFGKYALKNIEIKDKNGETVFGPASQMTPEEETLYGIGSDISLYFDGIEMTVTMRSGEKVEEEKHFYSLEEGQVKLLYQDVSEWWSVSFLDKRVFFTIDNSGYTYLITFSAR